MGHNFAARIQRFLRPSRYIPEGSDTSGERWDLPYGGSGRVLGGAPKGDAAQRAAEEEAEIDREWQDLLSWVEAPAPTRMAAQAPAQWIPREVLPPADEDAAEWAAALARVKGAFDPALQPRAKSEVPPRPVAAPLPRPALLSVVPAPAAAPSVNQKSEGAVCEHAGEHAGEQTDEHEEWEWAMSLARAKATTPPESQPDESAEWSRALARAKGASGAKREKRERPIVVAPARLARTAR